MNVNRNSVTTKLGTFMMEIVTVFGRGGIEKMKLMRDGALY